MAEIPIQRKEGHSLWWLWLLILIVVLAVAWWLWANHGTTTATTPADSTAITAPAAPPATTPADTTAGAATTAPRADTTRPR